MARTCPERDGGNPAIRSSSERDIVLEIIESPRLLLAGLGAGLRGRGVRLVHHLEAGATGAEINVDKYFTRKSTCPHRGRDLHICLNCRFYSETAHKKCVEPKAEFQRSRDTANFCDFFRFREGPASPSTRNEQDEARRRFQDLFKK